MITYTSTDLFSSAAQVLVNAVNTQGVMGKGIAAEFKRRYPEMFAEYRQRCHQGQFDVGQVHLFRSADKWILNFPTKKHWRHPARLEYIEAGLERFVAIYTSEGIQSVAFPMLGCGHGGLDWEEQVQPLMEHYLSDLPIEVSIHLIGRSASNP